MRDVKETHTRAYFLRPSCVGKPRGGWTYDSEVSSRGDRTYQRYVRVVVLGVLGWRAFAQAQRPAEVTGSAWRFTGCRSRGSPTYCGTPAGRMRAR